MRTDIGLIILLTISHFSAIGQRTFTINKNETDSIELRSYKIFSASENLEINFVGQQASLSTRFRLTRDEAITADKQFCEQYVSANMRQYYKQLNDPRQFYDSGALTQSKLYYKQSSRDFEKKVTKEQRKRIKNYDRYFYGYFNTDNEKLILMRFDPHKNRYYTIPGTGERHLDVLTIYVLNFDKNILSASGWADFKE
jgi:hypothetical protein